RPARGRSPAGARVDRGRERRRGQEGGAQERAPREAALLLLRGFGRPGDPGGARGGAPRARPRGHRGRGRGEGPDPLISGQHLSGPRRRLLRGPRAPARPPRPASLALTTVLLALLGMFGPFSIDTPFPAFVAMGEELDVSGASMQLVISAYLGSFAVMSLFHGPISDALGRKPVMVSGALVYALASIGCALAPSLPVLLVFRVLQGASAGAGTIVSRTVVRDLYEGPAAQRLMG